MSYGIKKISFKNVLITAVSVGVFHFVMPFLGNLAGETLFSYTIFRPKLVLFIIFLILSIDMFIQFFEKENVLKPLNIIGIILFSLSVSFDSFSVGLGISYLCNNIYLAFLTFCFISMSLTFLGFELGKKINRGLGKYSFLFGSLTLFIYSLIILTK